MLTLRDTKIVRKSVGVKSAYLRFCITLCISFHFRYKVIVYSATNRTPPKMSTAILTLIAIWGLSILLSFPLIFALDMKVVPIPHILMSMVGDSSIAYCAEEWGEYKKGRLVYSIFSLVVQVRSLLVNKIMKKYTDEFCASKRLDYFDGRPK